jgi:hypothetical protein
LTGQVWTPGSNLGSVVRKDIHNGNDAADEVIGVTNDARAR